MSLQAALRHVIKPQMHPLHRATITTTTTTTTTSDKRSQIFKLPDGRSLGYAEYGNPKGKPLLYFHGYPSSRIEAEPADAMALRCGIRLLALDRPGFGLSTPQPNRKLLDWPQDVRAFAAGMQLDRFAIMGLSGGGPFALACAYALPRSMLAGVGLFASGPAWEAGAQHMSFPRRVMGLMARHWPTGLGLLLGFCVRTLRAIATTGTVTRRIDAWLEAESKKTEEGDKQISDKQTKGTPKERREYLLRVLIDEPFRQGPDAAVLEADLLSSQNWGFKLEDVDYDPIRFWHGAKDANSPIAMIRYMTNKLRGSVLREYEDDTHYTMLPHMEEALKELSKDYDSSS